MNTHELQKIKKLDKKIRSLSFSADGQQLACGLADGILIVLDIE